MTSGRLFPPSLLCPALLLLLLGTVGLPGISHARNHAREVPPQDVAQSFSLFVERWVSSCQNEFAGTRNCTLLIETGGQFIQRFMEIAPASVSWTIKPTGNKRTPYVGVLKYVMNTFESRGPTRQAAVAAPFSHTRSRKITEIFRYSNGRWQE